MLNYSRLCCLQVFPYRCEYTCGEAPAEGNAPNSALWQGVLLTDSHRRHLHAARTNGEGGCLYRQLVDGISHTRRSRLATSASLAKRPSLPNAATRGFLPGGSSFLSTMSNAVSTTDAGLYVVLGDHLSTPPKAPRRRFTSRGRRRAAPPETPNVSR
jgi:hypothetical protein